MPRGVTQYRKKWESDHDPNGMLYGKWCKKYDEKNAWCDFCKKKLRVDGMGKCALKQHANNKNHKAKLVSDTQESQEIQQKQVNVQNEIENIDDCISKAEILWSLLCVEHDL